MMNLEYDRIISADDATRLGVFTTTAQRLGTTPQHVEKDFWVCWTLDALFNGLPPGPRLLFKGGTSLSKGFALIQRFSEDIDVTVFRGDLGQTASIPQLLAMSGKKRQTALDAIREACEAHIQGPLRDQLGDIVSEAAGRLDIAADQWRIDPDSEDAQALYLRYPTVTPAAPYVGKAVKIESGAKSALDPHALHRVRPYLESDVPGIDLTVANVTIVDAERTFWDKVIILHGLRRWFEIRGALRGNGQRVSRHYYDLHALLHSNVGKRARANLALGQDCVDHARLFFNRPAFDLASAIPGSFALCPEGDMVDDLRRDYRAMTGMIFGTAPAFDAVIESIAALQNELNATT